MFSLFRAALMKKGFLTDNTCLHSGRVLENVSLRPNFFTFRSNPSSNRLTYLPCNLFISHAKCFVPYNLQFLPAAAVSWSRECTDIFLPISSLPLLILPHFLLALATIFSLFSLSFWMCTELASLCLSVSSK